MRINIQSLQSLVLAAAFSAAAAFTAQPAMAESHQVNIPFTFVAAGHVCPAGTYSVREENYGGTIYLVSQDHTFGWISVPGDTATRDHRVVLTFDVTGGNHLLRTVQFGTMSTPRIDKNQRESIPAAAQIALMQ